MAAKTLLECSFYIPTRRDKNLSDGKPHKRRSRQSFRPPRDADELFALPDRASVGIHYRAGSRPGLLIALEILGWIVAVVGWRRTRAGRARRRAPAVTP